jgi:hypothetical protein
MGTALVQSECRGQPLLDLVGELVGIDPEELRPGETGGCVIEVVQLLGLVAIEQDERRPLVRPAEGMGLRRRHDCSSYPVPPRAKHPIRDRLRVPPQGYPDAMPDPTTRIPRSPSATTDLETELGRGRRSETPFLLVGATALVLGVIVVALAGVLLLVWWLV